ncbi:MAG: Smr/MutS family protein, partial [Pseudomonadota bacterium]
DLHGYSQDQAYDALYDFFERNYRAQKRYLLVITGKGKFCYDTYRNKGILKPKLPLWFYDSLFAKYISVYHKAAPCHGGDGAYYVVLKKQK